MNFANLVEMNFSTILIFFLNLNHQKKNSLLQNQKIGEKKQSEWFFTKFAMSIIPSM
jgi:hypothetical protein